MRAPLAELVRIGLMACLFSLTCGGAVRVTAIGPQVQLPVTADRVLEQAQLGLPESAALGDLVW